MIKKDGEMTTTFKLATGTKPSVSPSYESDELQNIHLKNDHTINVPLLTLYAIKLH